ncbi:Ig-like domain-containing protein [Alcanivorax sp. ZXX171]|nr:Ig-like domain-containing protein [Alcanivorax sp. ZXX171]
MKYFSKEKAGTTNRHYTGGVTALFLATSLVACGGGGGSSGGGESQDDSPAAFSVTAVTPNDGESGVQPDATLMASFNRDLLASSINNIQITKNNGVRPTNVPVSVTIDTANSVNIRPDEPLDILSEYSVTMTSDLSDNSGRPLSEAFPWHFVTRDGDWEQAGLIDTGSAVAKEPGIASDYDGNGWAVWLKEDLSTGNFNVIGRYYNADNGGWASQTLPLNSDETTSVSDPCIAVDLSGNAIVAWVQDDAVYARHWDVGSAADESSWSAVKKISGSNPVDGESLQVAFSASTSARAVWLEDGAGATMTLVSNNYRTVGAQWDGPVAGPDLDVLFGSASYVEFDADKQGNGIFLWSKKDDSLLPEADSRIHATRYDAAADNWVNTTTIEDGVLKGTAKDVQLDFDQEGNAYAAWSRTGTPDFFARVYVSRYDVDSGAWNGSTQIMGGREESDGRYPDMAVDLQGNAMVSFEAGEVYAAYYPAEEGQWSHAEEIGEFASNGHSDVTFDEDGNATVVWNKDDGGAKNIFSNRYAAITDSWAVEERIENGGGAAAGEPAISSYFGASPMAVWEDAGRIYANRFSSE